ncbi:unnamed protein product, partial [Polarella glacialis]
MEVAPDGDEDDELRQEGDTNLSILPSKRQKVKPEETAEEERPMSKRKKRKMEQIAQKKAGKEMRSDVLEQLKSLQLTSAQALLMRASQSTAVSKQDRNVMAQRRASLGVPLTAEMKKEFRPKKRPDGEAQATEGDSQDEADVSSDDALAAPELGASTGGAVGSKAPAGSSGSASSTAASSSSGKASSTPVSGAAGSSASASKSQTSTAGATSGATAATTTATTTTTATATTTTASIANAAPPTSSASLSSSSSSARTGQATSGAKASALKPLPKASVQPQLNKPAPQPLQRVRVERTVAIEEQRAKLPAVMMEQEMVEMALSNDVLLVCGDTGCGKSTQVPQFLYECGICNGEEHLIGVTQPRRVAAISVSQRVGQELGDANKVGYQVRYDKSHCSKDMRIKFMTDGILLREVQADFLCRKYTAIIIDEAHERGVNCDILIGLLSRAVQRRRRDYDEAVAAGRFEKGKKSGDDALKPLPPPPLKLVIMSATLRLVDFTENKQLFPTPPPVMRIDARTFPVTVHFARRTEDDYIRAAHKSVLEIHSKLPPGTILVFVTGKQEVHRLCKMLQRSQATASARQRAAEGGDFIEEAEAEGAAEAFHLLEASDDEGNASEDGPDDLELQDVPEARQSASVAEDGAASNKRKKQEPKRDVTVEASAEAEPPKTRKAGKKKRKQSTGQKEELPEGGAATEQKEVEKQDKKAQEEEEELTVSFGLGEEDVVVLDTEATKDEDAKDVEARNQRKIRMARLDKSRSAGGAFQGAGFGEGPLTVLPLYAQLAARNQLAPFSPPRDGERLVVVSTNVAETSVTLPNVRYVVDCGREKRRKYKASSGVSAFAVERISKASADQRAGR